MLQTRRPGFREHPAARGWRRYGRLPEPQFIFRLALRGGGMPAGPAPPLPAARPPGPWAACCCLLHKRLIVASLSEPGSVPLFLREDVVADDM